VIFWRDRFRRSAQPRDLYGKIKHDYNVLWRYVTKDKKFVMVNDNHERRDPTFAQTRPQGGHWFSYPPAASISTRIDPAFAGRAVRG